MRKTAEHAAHSTAERDASASHRARHPAEVRDLNDREAVIAVMVANGATCEDVATRLSLPVRTVESYLRQALQLLEITDVEDLTYVIVAAHYNRNSTATSVRPQERLARPGAHRP